MLREEHFRSAQPTLWCCRKGVSEMCLSNMDNHRRPWECAMLMRPYKTTKVIRLCTCVRRQLHQWAGVMCVHLASSLPPQVIVCHTCSSVVHGWLNVTGFDSLPTRFRPSLPFVANTLVKLETKHINDMEKSSHPVVPPDLFFC